MDFEYKPEIENINEYFNSVYIPQYQGDYVGATFSTMNYSELNTRQHNNSSDDIKKKPVHNCLQIKYENMNESDYDREKRRAILDIIHAERIRKWGREREQEKRVKQQQKIQRKRDREEQIKNYRLYYMFRLYDCFFGE